jgi:hypothetical protein
MAESADILTKLHDLLLYLIPQLNKFPLDQKFVLGDRIETRLLDVQEFCRTTGGTSAGTCWRRICNWKWAALGAAGPSLQAFATILNEKLHQNILRNYGRPVVCNTHTPRSILLH